MPSFICCLHATYIGNIQKAQPSAFRNSIKFLSLCSRLFLCNPIVMHWSWNQSPGRARRISMISDWLWLLREREGGLAQQHRQSNKQKRENMKNPVAPIQQRGPRGKLGSTSPGQKRVWATKWNLFWLLLFYLRWDFRTANSSSMSRVFKRVWLQNRGQLRRAEALRRVQNLPQLIVQLTKTFVCAQLRLTIGLIRCNTKPGLRM